LEQIKIVHPGHLAKGGIFRRVLHYKDIDDPMDEALLRFAQLLISLSVPDTGRRQVALCPKRHLQA
jgi:hypothetical protein